MLGALNDDDDDVRIALPPIDGPDTSYIGAWMAALSIRVERSYDRVSQVRQSINVLAAEVRRASEIAERATVALETIARSQGTAIQIQGNKAKQQEKWAKRIWEAPQTQAILTAILIAILQLFGLRYYITEEWSPHVVPADAQHEHSTNHGSADGQP